MSCRREDEGRNVYVQITGLHDEKDPMLLAKIDKETTDVAKKLGNMVNAQSIILHIDKHHKQGKKSKYSMRMRALTDYGLLVAKSWGWEPVNVVQDVVKNIEREAESRHSRKHGHFKHHEKSRKHNMPEQ